MIPTADWRQAAAQLGLSVTDLSEHVGSEIAGLDLGEALNPPELAMLRAACADRVVLLFRGQDALDPGGYVAFTQGFGDAPDLHSQRAYCLPDHHEIFVVGNVTEGGVAIGSPRVGQNWHTDHYHLPKPASFTFLHAIQVPAADGDTKYANGMAAFDALPPAMQDRIAPMHVRHSRARLFRMLFPEATEAEMAAEAKRVPDVVHPLVRTHPELGRRGLYLGGEWGSSIEGEDEAGNAALFEDLLGHLTQPRFGYRHAWSPGDVLMSDNRCSMHRASEWNEATETRRLHRIILLGNDTPH